MSRLAFASVRGARQHAIGGAQERGQPEIDQIDAGHTQRDIAGRHDTLVEQLVDQVEDGRLRSLEHIFGDGRIALGPSASTSSQWQGRASGATRAGLTAVATADAIHSCTKEYGGHGPVSVIPYPWRARARASRPACVRKVP